MASVVLQDLSGGRGTAAEGVRRRNDQSSEAVEQLVFASDLKGETRVKRTLWKLPTVVFVLAALVMFGSVAASANFNVAVMFPGTLGGNPLAAGIEEGVRKANALPDVNVRLIESPQTARWESDLRTLAATGQYDLIVTFTSGMSPIIPRVAAQFPRQHFALIDHEVQGVRTAASVMYSDMELGFLAGVFAALVADDPALGGGGKAVGLISGDTYPQMDDFILPGFRAGVRYVNPDIPVRYAVVGNWADPSTANELAQNMYAANTAIIFAVAGGGNSGVFSAARQAGAYAIGVNTNQNPEAPGTVLASVLKYIDNAVVAVIEQAAAGRLAYGSIEEQGIAQGAIDVARDELYETHVPASVRQRLDEIIAAVRAGEIDIAALAAAQR